MRLIWDKAAVLPDGNCAWAVELVVGAVAVDPALVGRCGSVGPRDVDELAEGPSDCTWEDESVGPLDGTSG